MRSSSVAAVALASAAVVSAGCSSADVQAPRQAAAAQTAGVANIEEGCVDEFDPDVDYFPQKVQAEHAQGWDVRYEGSYKIVTTSVDAAGGHAAAGSREVHNTYVLLQCGAPAPELTGDLSGANVIEVPARTVVDGGSVLYASLEELGLADALVGEAEPFVGETEAPYLPEVAERLATGEVAEIGYEVNSEALAEAAPDFYTNYAGDDSMFAGIEDLGIPSVLYFPYTETPLGAAEQVKFVSLFFNREARAQQVFDPIEQRYEELHERVQGHVEHLDQLPTVLVGVVGQDGQVRTRQHERFEPQLLREAGAVPVPDEPGGGIGSVSLESFLRDGADADFWLDLTFFGSGATKAEYLEGDPRLDALNPLHDGRVFTRVGRRGADYYLSGAVHADLMLADAVSILHPELLPDHELQFLADIPD